MRTSFLPGLLAAALFLAAPAAARTPAPKPTAGPDVVRVFVLKHRKAEDAFLLVRPLLGARGTIVLQTATNALTVRDTVRTVERVAQAVSSFDLPPRAIAVSVSLIRATHAAGPGGPPAPVAERFRGVADRLRSLFNFTEYSSLDEVVLQGLEGDPVSWTLGGSFRIDFLLEPGGGKESVRLRNLVLARLRRDEAGNETARDIARTSLNLRMREPFVLGIGREEGGSAALFLVLTADPVESGPGIAGRR